MLTLPIQRLKRIAPALLIIAAIILIGSVFSGDINLAAALITFWVLGTGLTLPIFITEHLVRSQRDRAIRAARVAPDDLIFTVNPHSSALAEARIDYQEAPDGTIDTEVNYDVWLLDLRPSCVQEAARQIIQREAQAQDAYRHFYTFNSKTLVRLYTEAQLTYIVTSTILVYIVTAFSTAGVPYASMHYWGPLIIAVFLGLVSLIALPWWMVSAIQRCRSASETLQKVLQTPQYTQVITTRYKPTRRIPLHDIYESELVPPKTAQVIFTHARRLRDLGLSGEDIEVHMFGMIDAVRLAVGDGQLPDDPEHFLRGVTAEYFRITPLYPR